MATENDVRLAEDEAELPAHIDQNLETLVMLQRREWEDTSVSQRRVERISRMIGRPAYLLVALIASGSWIAYNGAGPSLGWHVFDPIPFSILQGLLTLVALFTTTIVLIAQNRQTKLEKQHAHLDLQVNLLTEQKVSKLILLIEELRRDLPMVRDRVDPQATALQERVNTAQVLEAIKNVGLAAAAEEMTATSPNDAGADAAAPSTNDAERGP